jgi:hypothetical protein
MWAKNMLSNQFVQVSYQKNTRLGKHTSNLEALSSLFFEYQRIANSCLNLCNLRNFSGILIQNNEVK